MAACIKDLVDPTKDVASVKQEPETEESKQAAKVAEFKNNKKQHLRRFQDMLTSAKVMDASAAQSKDKKYVEPLINDISKHIARLTKLVKLLERSVTEDPAVDAMPKLFQFMEECKIRDDEVVNWAGKFVFLADAGPAKKRPRKRTAQQEE